MTRGGMPESGMRAGAAVEEDCGERGGPVCVAIEADSVRDISGPADASDAPRIA